IVCQLDAPSAMEPSRIECGTLLSAALLETIMTGMIIKDNVKLAASTEFPRPNCLTKIVKPSNPNTTDGTPAKFAILTSMKRVILLLVAYSSKYKAVPTDKNIAIGVVSAINQIVPINAPLIPARSGRLELKFVKNSILKAPSPSFTTDPIKITSATIPTSVDNKNTNLITLSSSARLEFLFSSITSLTAISIPP